VAGEYKANIVCYAFRVDEGRKRVLLIAASILAARRLAKYDKPCPGIESAVYDAISTAEKIMAKIDERFAEKSKDVKAHTNTEQPNIA
jgi:cell shape-determining protein MreC